MKKIILLASIAAAILGARKLMKGSPDDEFAPADDDAYAAAA